MKFVSKTLTPDQAYFRNRIKRLERMFVGLILFLGRKCLGTNICTQTSVFKMTYAYVGNGHSNVG